MWKELLAKLDITIDDPLLEQSVYQEVFEIVVQEYFESVTSSSHESTPKCSMDNMSSDELNVLRYAGGYVARTILKRYEKKTGDIAQQYVQSVADLGFSGGGFIPAQS